MLQHVRMPHTVVVIISMFSIPDFNLQSNIIQDELITYGHTNVQ